MLIVNRIVKLCALLLVAAPMRMLAEGNASPIESAAITGTWVKEFLVRDNVRNDDPRWELSLVFGENGKFRYLSKSTTEIWLSDGQVRPRVEEMNIQGTWSIQGNGKIMIQFDHPLSHKEQSEVVVNLHYNPNQNRAEIVCEVNQRRLTIRDLGAALEIQFKKRSEL
jgi:hypothetical protein